MRQGYFPSFLEPRRRSEQAIVAVVLKAYVNGVSTRKVDRLVEQLGIEGITKDRASTLCRALDEQVEAFRQRPLEGAYPYLWVDAKQVKVRDHGRVVSKALVIAYAVPETGVREVIGLDVGEVEPGAFWTEFLRALKKRGLSGVRLAVSDDHEGLKASIARVLSARGSGAPCTSSETCSTTAAATSAASSPPRSERCSTPRTSSRRASGSVT
jgi:putative transposase